MNAHFQMLQGRAGLGTIGLQNFDEFPPPALISETYVALLWDKKIWNKNFRIRMTLPKIQ